MAIVQRPLRADAARNRARLLAAAKEVFAARGLDATMDEVARRAGVGVGTAYRRFRNRDDLIAALFEERLDEFMDLLDESLADDDPWRGLSGFLERSMEMQAADRGFKELLLQSVEGRERMLRFRAHIRPLVAELVRRAREAGHPDIHYIPQREALAKWLAEAAREGDLVITLGAGNIQLACNEVIELLEKRLGPATKKNLVRVAESSATVGR